MSGLLKYLRWSSRYAVRQLYWRLRYSGSKMILGRYACLGAEVMRLLMPVHRVVNIQKGRVDYLVDCWKDPQYRARTLPVVQYMQREEIIDCVMQEELLWEWMNAQQPVALFMDSMAEHADQRFVHSSSGWSFLCSYTDLAHTEQFSHTFHKAGLLSANELAMCFRRFFENIRMRFGNIPIFYLHFPVKLETRQKFIDRQLIIRETIDSLSTSFQPFYSHTVDENTVDWNEERTPEMWNFAYHYNKRTYEEFAALIRATGAWPG